MLLKIDSEHLFGWASLGAAAAAVAVACLAFWSDRFFRTRDAAAKLLEQFESSGLHTLVWRMEQLTRPAEGKPWSLDRIDPGTLYAAPSTEDDRARRALIELMLAQDWRVERAGMHETYFFALRAHAWLSGIPWGRARRARLLNNTFGYQLLSTLLDHRTISLRLQSPERGDGYYPTQYGCLDPGVRDLVNRLARDLLERPGDKWPPPVEIVKALRCRWDATRDALAALDGEPKDDIAGGRLG